MYVFPFRTKKVWQCLFVLLFLITVQNLNAQDKTSCDYTIPGEILNWNFGEKVQLQFSEETFDPISTVMPGNIDLPKGVSSISDADGRLLFFSDGRQVFGSGYMELPNGGDLAGHPFSSQSALFIPSPGNPNRYFLITADLYIPPVFTNGIRYSMIEKQGNTWKVLPEKKNVLLLEQNATKLAAVQHDNGEDYWIVSHGFGEDKGGSYFSFRVMKDSISLEQVESTVGAVHQGGPNSNNNVGYLKISPNGKKLALVLPEDGKVEVADFNATTGVVSNPVSSIFERYIYPLGVEFSSNSKLLYVTTNPKNNTLNMLYQFDLDQLDINNPEVITSFNPNEGRQFGALQLAADGRIYISIFRQSLTIDDHLAVIYNPNRTGTACNFNMLEGNPTNGLALQDGSGSKEGLPNFISSYFDMPHFWWQNHCEKSPTIFRLQNEANAGDVIWTFSDDNTTVTQRRGEHIFENAGNYTVTATENYNDQPPYISNREIEIYPLPPVEIGNFTDTIFILPNSSITLDAGQYDEYLWYFEGNPIDGATQQTLDVEEEGLYKVVVTDTNCCVNEDEVVIWFANIYLPTAFRPKSNIPGNQTFKPLGAVAALNKFELLVYNRWGQLVFESKSPTNGWDGTINGQDAPMAAYVWLMRYESLESTFQAAQEVVQRGVINLVR